MACNNKRTKTWSGKAGTTFTQSVQGDEDGGFTAVASVFEGDKPPTTVKLHPGKPLKLKLKAATEYFVLTHILIVTQDSIDVQVSSVLDDQKHCTTVTGKDTTSKNVEHTILVGE